MYRHRQHYLADKYVKVCICERRRKRYKERNENQQNVFAWPGRENLSRLFLRFMRWWWYISELYSPSFRWPLSSWTYWRREKSVYNAWVPISVDVYTIRVYSQIQYLDRLSAGMSAIVLHVKIHGVDREKTLGLSHLRRSQIKSNHLLSHHHSTCALVSEILESVLQTVQNNLQIDSTYLQTYTEDNVQNTHSYSQYKQCTIKTCLQLPIHIIHSMYTFYIMYTYTQ